MAYTRQQEQSAEAARQGEEESAGTSGEGASYDDLKGEVLRFPGTCHSCGAHVETLMKPTGRLVRWSV